MLKLGGLLALIALAAAAFWLATSYDREQPSAPERATLPPAERESIEARSRSAPAGAGNRAPAESPPRAAPEATSAREAGSAGGQPLPPLVLPPPEPPPTQLW